LRPRTSFGKKVFLAVSVSLVALVVLVIVTVFSPLLAVSKIEVVGTKMVSEKSVLKDLASLKGKPLPQVSNDEVAARLGKYQLIDSVSVVSVPPNTLRVVVTERTAIAIVVVNNIRYLYDAAGVQLGRAAVEDRLPIISAAGNPATSKAFSRSIDVILSLPLSLLPEVEWIRATSKDNVVLNLRRNGQSVLWGDASAPGLKAEVLLALMKHYKRTLNITFDVSSPNQPSVY
jgi:cell division protein FtsQ